MAPTRGCRPAGPVVTSERPRRRPPRPRTAAVAAAASRPGRRFLPAATSAAGRARPGGIGCTRPSAAAPSPGLDGRCGNVDRDCAARDGRSRRRMTPAARLLLREHDLSPAQIHAHSRRWPDHPEDASRSSKSVRTGPPPQPSRRRRRPAPRTAGQPAAASTASPPAAGARPPRPPGPASDRPDRRCVPAGADEVLLPMTQMRKGIAAQMTRALAVPHAYVHMEVDATALVRARDGRARLRGPQEDLPQLRPVRHQGGRRCPPQAAASTRTGRCGAVASGGSMVVAVAVDDGLLVRWSATSTALDSGLDRRHGGGRRGRPAGKLRLEDYGGARPPREHRVVRVEPDHADHRRYRVRPSSRSRPSPSGPSSARRLRAM